MSSADDPESPGPTNPPQTAQPTLGGSPEEFVGGDPVGLGALAWVESQVNDCGGAAMRVSKTQISWARRRGFVTLWSPRRAAGHGADWALTVYLSRPDGTPRWKEITEVRPGLWAHHLELGGSGELNGQVAGWLHEACADASHVSVLNPGPFAIVVDEGRHGWAHLAVTTSGAFDRPAYQLANRLVGNTPGSAAIEFLLGPVSLRFHSRATIAITGIDADVTIRRDNGRSTAAATYSTVAVAAGSTVTIDTPRSGLRGYLAVRGGWDVAPVLGSRSRDTLAGLGPSPLAAGVGLPIGTDAGPFPPTDHAPRQRRTSNPSAHPGTVAAGSSAPSEVLTLRLLPAPRSEGLQLPTQELAKVEWTVSPESNRIGVRLDGPALRVAPRSHSEPLVRGAVQVPPNGQPVIMGPDHPTTGGYPVIGVIADADMDSLAQARPGTRVRLRPARP